MHDPIFLAGKSEIATKDDLQVAQDLLDTLMAHKENCVGMAANMIGVRKRIIAFLDESGRAPTYTVMLSPQSMSVERFFDRSDPEKQFLLNVIDSCDDPAAVMENYRQGLARINSKKHDDEYANSGFFTVVREDNGTDTREQVCDMIAKHFGLME